MSHIAPAHAEVGRGRPAFDHLPRPDAVIASGGQLFETGICAHAPALHRCDLAGVRDLALATEDAGDGRSSDWGLWLGAELAR